MIRVTEKQARDTLRSSVLGPKRSKFGNCKKKVEGVIFDSMGELDHWSKLCTREAAGEISNLERQVRFVICPPVKLLGEKRASAVTYVADYRYVENGITIVADFKGFDTPESRIKRRLLKGLKGIDVLIIRKKSPRVTHIAESERAA